MFPAPTESNLAEDDGMSELLEEARRRRSMGGSEDSAVHDDTKSEILGVFYPVKRRQHLREVDGCMAQLAQDTEEVAGRIITLLRDDPTHPSVQQVAGMTAEQVRQLLEPAREIYNSRLIPFDVIAQIGQGNTPDKAAYHRGFMLNAWDLSDATLQHLPEGLESVAQQMQRDLLGTSKRPGKYYLFYFKEQETLEPCGYVTVRVPPNGKSQLEEYRKYLQRELLGEASGDGYSLLNESTMMYRSGWNFKKMVENQLMDWGEIDTVCVRPKSGRAAYGMLLGALELLQHEGDLPKAFYGFRWANAFPPDIQHKIADDDQIPILLENNASARFFQKELGWETMASRVDPRERIVRSEKGRVIELQPERKYMLVKTKKFMALLQEKWGRLHDGD